jgi:hypothetical protein
MRPGKSLGGKLPSLLSLLGLLTLLSLSSLFSSDLLAQASNAVPISGGPILTPYGTVAANSPVRVCLLTSTGTPCSTTGVQLYSDYNLTQPVSDPIATNSQGIFTAFTTPGFYSIQVSTTPTTTAIFYFLAIAGSQYSTCFLAKPMSISCGGTGATTVLGAMQSLNIPTPCAAQSFLVGAVIFDCFNSYADGTVWSAQIAASGNSQWQVTGDGAHIEGQHLFPVSGPPSGNFYAWLPNTSAVGGTPTAITTMGGTFKVCPNNDGNPYAPGQITATMIASNVTNDLNHGFMHLEIGPTTWALLDTLTGTGGFYVVAQGQESIKPDCSTEYYTEMDIDVAAGTVKVILPGGQVANLTDPNITTINPVKGGWQARDVNDGSARSGWGSVWMGGPSQAKKYAATAGHGADIATLQGVDKSFQYVFPDGMGPHFTLSGAPGLYNILTGSAVSTFLVDATICLTANIPASVEQTLCFNAISRNGPGTMQGAQTSNEGANLIDHAVISNDGGGNIALALYKNTASDLIVSMTGTGIFTPITTYVAGAVPYTNQYTIQFSTIPPPQFVVTIPAGPGWANVATADVNAANQQLTGHFIMTARDKPASLAAEDLDAEVSGYSNGLASCKIVRSEGVENGAAPTAPISRQRCTTDGASHLIHWDLYNATATAVTLNAMNGTQTGAWTLNPNPTIGAVALADGGPDVAFGLPNNPLVIAPSATIDYGTNANTLTMQSPNGVYITGAGPGVHGYGIEFTDGDNDGIQFNTTGGTLEQDASNLVEVIGAGLNIHLVAGPTILDYGITTPATTTLGTAVALTNITGHGSKGPVCVDAAGVLYVGNNSGTGAPCP